MSTPSLNQVMSGVLPSSLRRVERAVRRFVRFVIVFVACAWLVYLGSWLYAAYRLWNATHSGDWSSFWSAYHNHWQLLGMAFTGISLTALIPLVKQGVALRRAIEAGDESVMPPAADQPLDLPSVDQPIGPEHLAALERPTRALARAQLIAGITLLAFLPVPALGLFVLLLIVADGELPPASDPLLLLLGIAVLVLMAVATLLCSGGGLLLVLRGRRNASPLKVTADEWGVEWTTTDLRPRQIRLAWHEARYLLTMTQGRPGREPTVTSYALDAGEVVLSWAVQGIANAKQRAASERLVRLIVTRTHLPLRTLALDRLPKSPEAPLPPDMTSPVHQKRNSWRALLLQPSCLGLLVALGLSGGLGLLGLALERQSHV